MAAWPHGCMAALPMEDVVPIDCGLGDARRLGIVSSANAPDQVRFSNSISTKGTRTK
jgi:hypothetical protein